jgi:hypothetical protein
MQMCQHSEERYFTRKQKPFYGLGTSFPAIRAQRCEICIKVSVLTVLTLWCQGKNRRKEGHLNI